MERDRQSGMSIGPAWAGPVPIGWDVVRVKHLSTIYSGGTPDRENKDYWDDGTIPWLNSGEVNQWRITEPSTFITEEGFRNSSAKWIPTGALVMALAGQGKTKGMVAQLAIAATCNQSMAAIVPAKRVHPRFMQWWLHANYETIRNLAGGEQRDGLNLEIVGNVPCPQPSVLSQCAIADYLDRTTARLDALIAAKERVLGLLAKKRRALITHAVTRGLDPLAPLRDSGIPWLGEVPAHWETPPVYARFEVQLGKMLDEKKITGAHLASYLRNVDVQWGAINTVDLPEMDFDEEDRLRYALRAGDILVCEGGEVGRCALWDGGHAECYYQKALHRLRPVGSKDVAAFFLLVMRTIADSGQFALQSSAATIQHLPAEKLRVVRYPAPPFDEQRAIVASVSAETSKLDALRAATERTITLLKERRAALIAAAVIGQIDVESAT